MFKKLLLVMSLFIIAGVQAATIGAAGRVADQAAQENHENCAVCCIGFCCCPCICTVQVLACPCICKLGLDLKGEEAGAEGKLSSMRAWLGQSSDRCLDVIGGAFAIGYGCCGGSCPDSALCCPVRYGLCGLCTSAGCMAISEAAMDVREARRKAVPSLGVIVPSQAGMK